MSHLSSAFPLPISYFYTTMAPGTQYLEPAPQEYTLTPSPIETHSGAKGDPISGNFPARFLFIFQPDVFEIWISAVPIFVLSCQKAEGAQPGSAAEPLVLWDLGLLPLSHALPLGLHLEMMQPGPGAACCLWKGTWTCLRPRPAV